MKTLRLSFKLLSILLVAMGISSCGDDDKVPNCITCTYSYTYMNQTYTYSYEYCKSDTDAWEDDFDTWEDAVTFVKAYAAQNPDLTCK